VSSGAAMRYIHVISIRDADRTGVLIFIRNTLPVAMATDKAIRLQYLLLFHRDFKKRRKFRRVHC
jgi:hypothetical protein